MSARTDSPPACPADAEYTVELQARHRQLEAQVAGAADEAVESMTPAEFDELGELRDLFARFRQWRGKVDRFYTDEKKDRERPPLAADKDGGIARALRVYVEGKRARHETRREMRDRAVFRPSGDRAPGTGIDRMAEGLRKGHGLTR